MSTNVRGGAGVVAVGLFIWLLVIFFTRPTLQYAPGFNGPASVTVKCTSLVAEYVGDDHTYDELPSHSSYMTHYTVVTGKEPSGTVADPFGPEKRIDAECAGVLTGRAGTIGLLAVPVAVLAAVSLLARRREITVAAVRKVVAAMPDPAEPPTG